jgi:hypothetical protein
MIGFGGNGSLGNLYLPSANRYDYALVGYKPAIRYNMLLAYQLLFSQWSFSECLPCNTCITTTLPVAITDVYMEFTGTIAIVSLYKIT